MDQGRRFVLARHTHFWETNDQNSTHHKAIMVNRPPHLSMNGRHSERPLCRAAIHLISGLVLWGRGGCGRWAARGLSSGRFAVCCGRHVFLHCMRLNIGNTPSINRMSMSVFEALLSLILCIGYRRKSGEAEKRSNCQISSNILHE
jgi:hypothetical protein